jgi:hypothetical protein
MKNFGNEKTNQQKIQNEAMINARKTHRSSFLRSENANLDQFKVAVKKAPQKSNIRQNNTNNKGINLKKTIEDIKKLIFKDSDTSIILLILLMLLEEKDTETELIIALLYLLI